MRNSVLKRTDGQTDGEKSALVELRFAAKNVSQNLPQILQNLNSTMQLLEKRYFRHTEK